jgi:23S rRNA pseudouridine1911/1915/1917 synthase
VGFHAGGSWLEIELKTGRTHQIRAQAASRGYPVLGDWQYGSRIAFGPPNDDERKSVIALHARELCFFHPTTRAETLLQAPVSSAWEALGLGEPNAEPVG